VPATLRDQAGRYAAPSNRPAIHNFRSYLSATVAGTQFVFISQAGGVAVSFYGSPEDIEYERLINTMIRSVKDK
jgi:hypothetical protein